MAPESAMKSIDPRVADVLFILTLTNSVVNPYVYGSYASEMRSKCFQWFGLRRRRRSGENTYMGPGSIMSDGCRLGGDRNNTMLATNGRGITSAAARCKFSKTQTIELSSVEKNVLVCVQTAGN